MIAEAKPKAPKRGNDGLPLYNFFWHEEYALLSEEVEALEQIKDALDEAHRVLVERLALAVRAWDINLAQSLLAELGIHLDRWEALTNATVGDAMERAWDEGSRQVVGTMRASGVLTVTPFIPRDYLLLSQTTVPNLIRAISQETRLSIARDLRVSILAGETPIQFLARLGAPSPRRRKVDWRDEVVPMYAPRSGEPVIQTGPFAGRAAVRVGRQVSAIGRFPSAFHRAEAILRTEMGRLASMSNQMTLTQVNRTNPGMQKQWSAILDARTRPEHVAAHGQIVGANDKFSVGGEELEFPRDPRGDPSNTVNCRCVALPWHPSWEKYGFSTELKQPEPATWEWRVEPRGSWKPPLTR